MSNRVVEEFLARYPIGSCWRVALSYGSVVLLEFGDKLTMKTKDGSFFLRGSSTLTLYADEWCALEGSETIVCADTVTRASAESILTPRFMSSNLLAVHERSKGRVQFDFTQGLSILIDRDDQQVEDELFHLVRRDGRFLIYSESEGFRVPDEVDGFLASH